MVKRLFKRSIACLLAVLMIVTALPLTALADSTTDNVIVEKTATAKFSKTGLINYDGGRFKNSYYQIVNDSTDSSYSLAYWQYNTSDVSSSASEFTSASFDINFESTAFAGESDSAVSLSVYYVANDKANELTGGDTRLSTLYTGSDHINKATSYFNLQKIADISRGEITGNGKVTVDVKEAFNYAIAQKEKYVTLMVMCSSASASGSPWSDIYVTASKTSVTCKYSEEVEVIPGVEGIDKQIAAYEQKMSNVGTNGLVYKKMLPAYEAYVKAVRYRDAFAYGAATAPTEAELNAASEDLAAKTAAMEGWVDDVTGQFESLQPSFTSNEGKGYVNNTTVTYYSNIVYTEDCVGLNHDKKGGDSSGMAAQFDEAGNTYVQIYFPNTVLLYDGKTPAIMPVMFMARKTFSNAFQNKARYIHNVYACQAANSTSDWSDKKIGVDKNFNCISTFNDNNRELTWKGKDGTNNLDFNNCRNNGSAYVGAEVNNITEGKSDNLGYSAGNYWNAYATSFQVDGTAINADFTSDATDNRGYRRVGQYWAWYGGSEGTDVTAVDGNMKGYKITNGVKDSSGNYTIQPRRIAVFNYKGLADAIQNRTMLGKLAAVSSYKQNGLHDLIALFDNATDYANQANIKTLTTDNVLKEGQKITKYIDGINEAEVTEDTGASAYDALKSEISKSKKIYNSGNADYSKYNKEVWDEFEAKYQAATGYFANLYTNDLVMADAEQYTQPLTTARENLKNGMLKTVVETKTLEYAIDNAEALAHNATYFKSGTVDATTITALTKEIKLAIWGSEEAYGFDTEKIEDSAEAQAKVENYLTQLCALIEKAEVNLDNVMVDTGYSLTSAIAYAKTYEKDKSKYGNYMTLESALSDAETYKASLGTFNGRIKDTVTAAISNYSDIVTKIVNAVRGLQPAFSQISNGTPASQGRTIKTEFTGQRANCQKFYWEYTTDPIIFRTERTSYTYELPTSKWGSWNVQTGTDYETVFDSIILDANRLASGEIVSKQAGGQSKWPADCGLTASQLKDYKASTQFNVGGMDVAIKSAKVTKSTGKAYGVDSAGADITNADHDFIKELEVTDGSTAPGRGGIYAKNGWTEFNTKTTVTITDYTSAPVNETNKPSKVSKALQLGNSTAYFGIVFFWRYCDNVFANFAGYDFERAKLALNVRFVDLYTLFELIDQCSSADFVATKNQYTAASWKTLTDAIEEANENFDYGNMEYADILAECDRRYDALWLAKKNLQKAASNTALKNALTAAENAYNKDEAKVRPETWTKFKTAYERALSKYQNEYSDINIVNVAASDQSAVDEYTTALTNAFNGLVYMIDFTPVDNAVATLVDSVEDNKYTAASVQAVADAIGKLHFYTMSTAERKTHYEDETDVVAAVKEEAEKTIPGLASLLVESTVDSSVLEALKVEGRSKMTDPDAYDQDAIDAALAKLTDTQTVLLGNSRVVCKSFATQKECDDAVTNALNGIQLRQYTVTIVPDGDQSQSYSKGPYAYGTQVTVALPSKPTVDWYYQMKSPTATVANKLFSTTEELTFIIRGDTVLTTKSASTTNQSKVTYFNGINSAIVATDYVATGSELTLNASLAPKYPYYTFDSFKVNGKTYSAGEKVTISDNTNITLVYNFTGSKNYTVYVVDMSYGYGQTGLDFKIENLQYNDELVFKRGQTANEGYNGSNVYYTVNRGNDSKTTTVEGAGRAIEEYSNPEVYAWVEVGADDLADWYAHGSSQPEVSEPFKDGGYIYGSTTDTRAWNPVAAAITKGKVVKLGTDYSFRVHKDTLLIPLDEYTYNLGVKQGIITEPGNSDGARVDSRSDLVIAPSEKLSIISQFVLPSNCELVEKGLLLKINKNGAIDGDGSDLKLANAGKNGVNRLKSNYTTSGDQFVVSIKTSSIAGKAVSQVGLQWVSYLTYKNAKGELVTEYSPVTTPTNTTDTF